MTAELLAPAGSPESLDAAIGEGADAVYLGLKDFNARMRSANFTYSQFEGALKSLHRTGRKLYVTVNTVFEQREADRVYQLLKYLAGLGPDGILVQDFGIITMARENFPSLKLHASTQMNVSSSRGVNLLSRYGFSRAVLARELSLDEIREIRANTNMELETFIHGALCISISGICLFSSYLGGKSANRGMCTQACRRFYTAQDGNGFQNPEEGGGYYFSPADLELIEQIPALVEAGVNSFKIEGRMKSAEYVGAVVSAYRLVLDNLDAGETALRRAVGDARTILKNDFARSKTIYLINGTGNKPDASVGSNVSHKTGTRLPSGFDWLNPKQSGGTGIPLGKLLRVKTRDSRNPPPRPGRAEVTLRREEKQGLISGGVIIPAVGDSVRLHKADDTDRVSHKLISCEEGPDGGFWISIPDGFDRGDAVYLIQTRAMTRRYASVIPRNHGETSRGPGRDRAPLPNPEPAAKTRKDRSSSPEGSALKNKKPVKGDSKRRRVREDFPEGIYIMASRIEDLYVIQSIRPVKVILPCSRRIVKQLSGKSAQALPFSARDIILFLDPFFSPDEDRELNAVIPELLEKGYTRFIANNAGHFSLLRKGTSAFADPGSRLSNEEKKAALIAGPWLYTFNAWAWDFLNRIGAEYCITPFENNRQNLERSFPANHGSRSRVFITVFSRPSLFRIRQDLGEVYDFKYFTGNRDESFFFVSGPETAADRAIVGEGSNMAGTLVYPWEPFSIVDKIPFLREAGFTRFILDFSDKPLKKSEYRETMEAVNKAAPLPGTDRFNWKDGFFREPSA